MDLLKLITRFFLNPMVLSRRDKSWILLTAFGPAASGIHTSPYITFGLINCLFNYHSLILFVPSAWHCSDSRALINMRIYCRRHLGLGWFELTIYIRHRGAIRYPVINIWKTFRISRQNFYNIFTIWLQPCNYL